MIFEEILTCDPRSSWSAERRRNPRPIQNKSSRPNEGRSTSKNIDDGFVGSVHGTERAPFVSASKSISSSGAHVQPKGLFWLPVPCLAWILILRLAALLRCRGRTVHKHRIYLLDRCTNRSVAWILSVHYTLTSTEQRIRICFFTLPRVTIGEAMRGPQWLVTGNQYRIVTNDVRGKY